MCRVTESHGDISHHGGNCRVESQRERPLASHDGGNCRVEAYITKLPETPQKIFVVNHGPVPGFRGYHSNYTECPKII